MEDAGGIPWIFIHIGIAMLGAALAFGIWRNRSRRLGAGEKQAQRARTRRNFRVDEDSA